ncbi:hypothetical protein VCR3J2_420104 [Vibrio coralliirubri]|nr:hypothetical protein VCR3J2_420104 [Vibrio coralliirubri]
MYFLDQLKQPLIIIANHMVLMNLLNDDILGIVDKLRYGCSNNHETSINRCDIRKVEKCISSKLYTFLVYC